MAAADSSASPSEHRPRGPWLVADIGGTHARFGWVDDPARLSGQGRDGAAAEGAVTEVRTLACADHAGPVEAARVYLAALAARRGGGPPPVPAAAAFAVATAVTGDRVAFTNSGWAFSQAEAARALALPADGLRVINDFEAQALSLPLLGPSQRRPIGGPAGGAAPGRAAMAVVGPGTGLGVGALVPVGAHGWVAVPGEGGHATLAAADDEEAALLAWVRRRFPHVSAERLLSGMGLPVLHAAVAATAPSAGRAPSAAGGGAEAEATARAAAPADGAAATAAAGGDRSPVAAPAGPDARAIVEAGLSGDDPLCRRTLALFCALLGGFAGNVALTLGARGGVFIGGGIVPRMADFFAASRFRERFEAKGRFEPYLRAVPTWLVTDTTAALTGAAAALRQQG